MLLPLNIVKLGIKHDGSTINWLSTDRILKKVLKLTVLKLKLSMKAMEIRHKKHSFY